MMGTRPGFQERDGRSHELTKGSQAPQVDLQPQGLQLALERRGAADSPARFEVLRRNAMSPCEGPQDP